MWNCSHSWGPPGQDPVEEWLRHVCSANTLVEAGDFAGAHAIYDRALESAASAGDQIRVAVVRANLGRLHERTGQTLDAEKQSLRAISILKGIERIDARLLAHAYAALTSVYNRAGRSTEAESLIREALALPLPEDSAERASLLGSLGVIPRPQGRAGGSGRHSPPNGRTLRTWFELWRRSKSENHGIRYSE